MVELRVVPGSERAALESAFPVVLEVYAGLVPGGKRPTVAMRLFERGDLVLPPSPVFADALLFAVEGALLLAFEHADDTRRPRLAILLELLDGMASLGEVSR